MSNLQKPAPNMAPFFVLVKSFEYAADDNSGVYKVCRSDGNVKDHQFHVAFEMPKQDSALTEFMDKYGDARLVAKVQELGELREEAVEPEQWNSYSTDFSCVVTPAADLA